MDMTLREEQEAGSTLHIQVILNATVSITKRLEKSFYIDVLLME